MCWKINRSLWFKTWHYIELQHPQNHTISTATTWTDEDEKEHSEWFKKKLWGADVLGKWKIWHFYLVEIPFLKAIKTGGHGTCFLLKYFGDCACKRTMGYSCAVLSTVDSWVSAPGTRSIEFVITVIRTRRKQLHAKLLRLDRSKIIKL